MNVYMIVGEPQDLEIVVVTWGGATTRVDQDKPQEKSQPQVRPAAHKMEPLNVQKQKEVLWDVKS